MGAVIGIIPARFGSTRFEGKPLALIEGKPLIQRTHENAARCTSLDRLLVATDHPEIAECVKAFGGEVVMTSPTCRCGTERIAEVVERHLEGARGSILVNLQGDWPCIPSSVITRVVDLLKTDWGADIGTAAYRLTSPKQLFDPSTVKCVMDQRGRALYFSRAPLPYCQEVTLDALLPQKRPYYGHLGIYSYRPDFLLRYKQLPPSLLETSEDLEQLRALEHGYEIKVAIVEQTGTLSVDQPEDLVKLETYLCDQSICSSQEASSPLLAKG